MQGHRWYFNENSLGFHANLGNGIFMGFPYDLTNPTWDYPEADVVRINWFVSGF